MKFNKPMKQETIYVCFHKIRPLNYNNGISDYYAAVCFETKKDANEFLNATGYDTPKLMSRFYHKPIKYVRDY